MKTPPSLPNVKALVEDFFRKTPFTGVSPLEAVARGATILAAKIKGGIGIPDIHDLEYRDIGPLPIAVEVTRDRTSVLIQARTQLSSPPCKFDRLTPHLLYTTQSNQTSITFVLYEGHWKMTTRNRTLGSFTVDQIPPAEAGGQPVKLTWEAWAVRH